MLRTLINNNTLVIRGSETGIYPICSNPAWLYMTLLKIEPRDSAGSNIEDKYIYFKELEEGTDLYIQFINLILFPHHDFW
jgi:hypothetical protein